MRQVDLAVFADELAGEAASLAARAERARARLRQCAIEREASADLDEATLAPLARLGLIGRVDERSVRAELRELVDGLRAVESLQAWVERRLAV